MGPMMIGIDRPDLDIADVAAGFIFQYTQEKIIRTAVHSIDIGAERFRVAITKPRLDIPQDFFITHPFRIGTVSIAGLKGSQQQALGDDRIGKFHLCPIVSCASEGVQYIPGLSLRDWFKTT